MFEMFPGSVMRHGCVVRYLYIRRLLIVLHRTGTGVLALWCDRAFQDGRHNDNLSTGEAKEGCVRDKMQVPFSRVYIPCRTFHTV